MTPRTAATTLALSLAMTFAFTLRAGGQTLDWIRQEGTVFFDRPGGVAVDGLGGVFAVGGFGGNGPPGGFATAAFIRRYDGEGNILWTRTQSVSGLGDRYNGVATDAFGNAIAVGFTASDLVAENQGGNDLLLAKYRADGSFVWARQLGTEAHEGAWDVTVDAAGNIFIAGRTRGVLGEASAGGFDAFVGKFDENGDHIWTRQFGTDEDDWAFNVAVGDADNIYVVGRTRGRTDEEDGFLKKYDTDGLLLWERVVASDQPEAASGVAVDARGSVFVSGTTRGDVGGLNQGESDVYLRKYNADGDIQWTRQFGTEFADIGRDLVTDGLGNTFVVGYTGGDLGAANAGELDVYVTAFDDSGELLRTVQIGTDMLDFARDISIDRLGNLFITGDTLGAFEGVNFGGRDVYFAKFTVDLPQPGDTDGDGDVDVDDLNAVRNNFGTTGADDGSLAGDARPFDGSVDINDLNAVRNNFGASSTAVAEPSSMLLALAALASGWTPRRRRRRG